MIVSIATIEREARTAAQEGKSLNDACPYPFSTPEGDHFRTCYHAARNELGASINNSGALQ